MDTKPQTIIKSMLLRHLTELEQAGNASGAKIVRQLLHRLEGRIDRPSSLLDVAERTGCAVGFDDIYDTLAANELGMEIRHEMEKARPVILALRQFRDDIDALMSRIEGKQSFTRQDLDDLRVQFSILKADLAAAAKRGTVDSAQTRPNQFEIDYFGPAVRAASANLRARVNSHPVRGEWYSSLYGARIDITHPLAGLECQFPNF